MMIIDAPAAALPAAALSLGVADIPAGMPDAARPSRWAALGEDLRFFLVCYLAGLVVFLVMLS